MMSSEEKLHIDIVAEVCYCRMKQPRWDAWMDGQDDTKIAML